MRVALRKYIYIVDHFEKIVKILRMKLKIQNTIWRQRSKRYFKKKVKMWRFLLFQHKLTRLLFPLQNVLFRWVNETSWSVFCDTTYILFIARGCNHRQPCICPLQAISCCTNCCKSLLTSDPFVTQLKRNTLKSQTLAMLLFKPNLCGEGDHAMSPADLTGKTLHLYSVATPLMVIYSIQHSFPKWPYVDIRMCVCVWHQCSSPYQTGCVGICRTLSAPQGEG